MRDYKMYIDGQFVEAASGKKYVTVNPATEEEIANIPLGAKEDVDKAVAAAKKAFPIWSGKPKEERSRILKEIAAKIRERSQELVDMDIIDHGTPIKMASIFGRIPAIFFESFADLSKTILGEGEINIVPGMVPYVQREPIGVVACIVPWNIPLMIAAKIASSLAMGNTCVAKPPSVNAIGALQIAEMMAEHPDLPPGAVNVVTGPGNTVGEALASHPDVGMVSFTGSCEAGKSIMTAAGNTVKRLFLELGGKNPFIVFEDADFEKTVAGAVDAQYYNTGMLCGAPGRIYVPEKLHDRFVERFIELSKDVVTGDPYDEKTQMGPVVSVEHRDRVENFIKIGVEEGADLVYGGKRPTEAPLNKGYYVTPAVFTNVTQQMTLAREEIFGPVAVFMKYSPEDDVVALANDNTFGLAASVWTQDQAKGLRIANAIQAGIVWVNTHNAAGNLPWGGVKESGFGREGGVHGLKEYTQLKGICVNL